MTAELTVISKDNLQANIKTANVDIKQMPQAIQSILKEVLAQKEIDTVHIKFIYS